MNNFNINLIEMKKKIEIENNLLTIINSNLKECFSDLQYIKENYEVIMGNLYLDLDIDIEDNFILLEQIIIKKNINQETKSNLYDKLFDYVNQIYWYFQYFYLKKKDFMGMNLTGLVQGKMETGLGFRNSLEKMSISTIKKKFPKLVQLVKSNNIIYRINTNSFTWDKFGLDIYPNLFIVCDLEIEKYYFIIEKFT
jgi:hypothetical protein